MVKEPNRDLEVKWSFLTSDDRQVGLALDERDSLNDLTLALNAFCATVESSEETLVAQIFNVAGQSGNTDWPGNVAIADVTKWERATRRLERLERLTTIVLSGSCGGAIVDVLACCDLRVATEDLSLRLPKSKGRVWPGLALYRLTLQLGANGVRRLITSTGPIGAGEAAALGLVDQVVADISATDAIVAAHVGNYSGQDMAVRRLLVLEAATSSYDDALGAHLAACDRELRLLD